jgi:hypothetical protein
MALTAGQLLARIQAIEATLGSNQTALDNLVTKRELRNLLALLSTEINAFRAEIDSLDQILLSPILRSYLDDRFYQKTDFIDVTQGSIDAGLPVKTNYNGVIDASLLAMSGIDHGGLDGLEDDDHEIYHTDARGDARYYTEAESDTLLATKSDSAHTHFHSTLSGLNNDDHSIYHTDVRGDLRYNTRAEIEERLTASGITNGNSHDHSGGDGGTISHGSLSNLLVDNHTQYFLADGSRSVSGSILPATNNLHDIGSNSFNWRRGFFDAIVASGIKCTTHPLGLGSKYGVTSHSLTSEDVMIGGSLEVNGDFYSDNNANLVTTYLTSTTIMSDNAGLAIGGLSNGSLLKAILSREELGLWLRSTTGRQFIIGDINGFDKDHDHAPQTNPTLYVQSAINPDTDNTQWLSLYHDQTNGVIGVGKGKLKVADGAGNYGGIIASGLYNLSPPAPTSASDTGTTGEIRWDNTYLYVCIGTNTWQRTLHATW